MSDYYSVNLLNTIVSLWGRTKIDTCLIGVKWLKMPCVKKPHEMCFLAHRVVWFEPVKAEKYPIRLNSLLNYHISNHIWPHVRSKMISKSNILIIIAQNDPEQFHDQIVLFQSISEFDTKTFLSSTFNPTRSFSRSDVRNRLSEYQKTPINSTS